MSQITVWGVGCIGKATADAFEHLGATVTRYDKYKREMNDVYVAKNSAAIFVCVPTATDAVTGKQNLEPLEETFAILRSMNYQGIIVIKSTVLPGTTREMARKFKFTRVIHNPEFLTAARPYEDFLKQKTVLLGGTCQLSVLQIAEFYKNAGFKNVITYNKPEYTEVIKYMRNNFLATKVGFFNDQYEICQRTDVNYEKCVDGMLELGGIGHSHTRVPGPDGFGYSGLCFPKDTLAQLTWAKELGLEVEQLEATVKANNRRRKNDSP